jgi:hypothetical protein
MIAYYFITTMGSIHEWIPKIWSSDSFNLPLLSHPSLEKKFLGGNTSITFVDILLRSSGGK